MLNRFRLLEKGRQHKKKLYLYCTDRISVIRGCLDTLLEKYTLFPIGYTFHGCIDTTLSHLVTPHCKPLSSCRNQDGMRFSYCSTYKLLLSGLVPWNTCRHGNTGTKGSIGITTLSTFITTPSIGISIHVNSNGMTRG